MFKNYYKAIWRCKLLDISLKDQFSTCSIELQQLSGLKSSNFPLFCFITKMVWLFKAVCKQVLIYAHCDRTGWVKQFNSYSEFSCHCFIITSFWYSISDSDSPSIVLDSSCTWLPLGLPVGSWLGMWRSFFKSSSTSNHPSGRQDMMHHLMACQGSRL